MSKRETPKLEASPANTMKGQQKLHINISTFCGPHPYTPILDSQNGSISVSHFQGKIAKSDPQLFGGGGLGSQNSVWPKFSSGAFFCP